jgi:hypothetical protein
MVTIRESVLSVVAAAVGMTALCVPTDMGTDLSKPGAHTAAPTEINPGVQSEPVLSPANEGAKPLAARLEFTQRGLLDPTALPVGRDTKGDAVQSAPPDRRLNRLGDVPTTLPASTAPPVFLSTMLEAPKMSGAAIRALQRELTRHGCYSSEIDGDWGPASRYAAAALIEAVNAKLPVDQPSEFLLALSRQHQGPVCEQPGSITTASTTQRWHATVTPPGPPDRGVERSPTATVLAYAPRLTSPPRIVRANGAHPMVDLAEVPEMPLSPPDDMDQGARMALGADPSEAQRSELEAITRDRISRQKRDAARRAAARSRQGQARKRTSQPRWMRQVVQSVNLSGS